MEFETSYPMELRKSDFKIEGYLFIKSIWYTLVKICLKTVTVEQDDRSSLICFETTSEDSSFYLIEQLLSQSCWEGCNPLHQLNS